MLACHQGPGLRAHRRGCCRHKRVCKKLNTSPHDTWWIDAQVTGHTTLAGLFEVCPAKHPHPCGVQQLSWQLIPPCRCCSLWCRAEPLLPAPPAEGQLSFLSDTLSLTLACVQGLLAAESQEGRWFLSSLRHTGIDWSELSREAVTAMMCVAKAMLKARPALDRAVQSAQYRGCSAALQLMAQASQKTCCLLLSRLQSPASAGLAEPPRCVMQKRQEDPLLQLDPASLTKPRTLARDLRRAELHVLELWQSQAGKLLNNMAGALAVLCQILSGAAAFAAAAAASMYLMRLQSRFLTLLSCVWAVQAAVTRSQTMERWTIPLSQSLCRTQRTSRTMPACQRALSAGASPSHARHLAAGGLLLLVVRQACTVEQCAELQ